MALTSFRVENERALQLAECEAVPSVMIVAGPNGVGKSTLLYALSRRTGTAFVGEGDTEILYQPPHRAIRRQQVQRRWLTGQLQRLAETFSGQQVSGFEGLNLPFPNRAPDNVDEAGSTIKYTLGRLENRRQAVLAAMVDDHSRRGLDLVTGELPDVFEPIRRLTSRLLPHLSFERIDFSNEDDIRCVFRRSDAVTETELDLDDLSSGEKAIFILFLPLIETDITARLEQLTPEAAAGVPAARDRVFLIDETEQHLHPELQTRLLGYLREESAHSSVQFIVTTHSPTLVDQSFDDELYLLTYADAPGANQLRRIASNAGRLETLRALTGNTFAITTGRTVVCIEGERDPSGEPSDLALLQTLHPAASRYTFVPVGGKGNVIRVVTELRSELSAEGLGIRVAGIVDRDRAATELVPGVVAWPACMIENLLLDPEAIAAETRRHGIDADRPHVEALLAAVAEQQREKEIGLRVTMTLKPRTFRIGASTPSGVKERLQAAAKELDIDDDEIDRIVQAATDAVDERLRDGSYRQVFRGKALLKGLYRQLGLADAQVSYEQFTYGVAQRLAVSGALRTTIDAVFASIDAEPPASLVSGHRGDVAAHVQI